VPTWLTCRPSVYSFDDSDGDIAFSDFDVNAAPSYLFSVINDIQSVNSSARFFSCSINVHNICWLASSESTRGSLVTSEPRPCSSLNTSHWHTQPGWMKTSGTMDGGSLTSSVVDNCRYFPIDVSYGSNTSFKDATYLLKSLQGFNNNGISLYAISIQNEVLNSNPTYPSCTFSPQIEGQIGTALRSLMNSNGFSDVKIIGKRVQSYFLGAFLTSWLRDYLTTGYEHNWSNAASYPVQLMDAAEDAFAGVAFHCYEVRSSPFSKNSRAPEIVLYILGKCRPTRRLSFQISPERNILYRLVYIVANHIADFCFILPIFQNVQEL